MSLYDYRESLSLSAQDPSFYALIMAALRKADTFNMVRLRVAFPEVYAEFQARYNAPGGVLETDTVDLLRTGTIEKIGEE